MAIVHVVILFRCLRGGLTLGPATQALVGSDGDETAHQFGTIECRARGATVADRTAAAAAARPAVATRAAARRRRNQARRRPQRVGADHLDLHRFPFWTPGAIQPSLGLTGKDPVGLLAPAQLILGLAVRCEEEWKRILPNGRGDAPSVKVLPRVLADRVGLTSGLSQALSRVGFDPVYDRGGGQGRMG